MILHPICHNLGVITEQKACVLLASGSASGTISAVRNVGANGFEVGVVSSHLLSNAAWSPRASSCHSAPPQTSGHRLVQRLLSIGKDNPGQILLRISDETAWLYAPNVDVPKQQFRVYQPSFTFSTKSCSRLQRPRRARRFAELAPTQYSGSKDADA